jgi:hypothetical protein
MSVPQNDGHPLIQPFLMKESPIQQDILILRSLMRMRMAIRPLGLKTHTQVLTAHPLHHLIQWMTVDIVIQQHNQVRQQKMQAFVWPPNEKQ